MTRPYETMYILRPDLSEDQVSQAIEKYNNFLTENSAQDIEVKKLGKKKLAYQIKKFSDGIYIQLNYKANGTQVAPLERFMRLNDDVIRYLTIAAKEELVLSTPTEDTSSQEENTQN